MELHLTIDIEQALVEQAQQRGTTPEQLALAGLREQFVHPRPPAPSAETPGTLAEFLAGSLGVLHSHEQIPGGARMSEQTGDAFTRALAEKRQQGRL